MTRTRTIVLLTMVAATVMGLLSPAAAASATFVAEADAFVNRRQASSNKGGLRELRILNDIKRTYVQFDVVLPTGETVTSATLRLFATTGPVCAQGAEVLRSASDAWGERTITWNNQPGPAASLDTTSSWSANGYVSFDVTPAVSGSGVVSFVLRHTPGCNVSSDAVFQSREAANDPQLVVESSSGPAPPPQCADDIDNDSDGATDYPVDPGCTDATDDDETDVSPPPEPQCSDGVDNDSDGPIDFPDDPGCTNESDDDETDPPVSDTPAVVAPFAETPAIGTRGDRADDPAISAEFVVGTDKGASAGGLEVYNVNSGDRVSRLGNIGDTDNVDVRPYDGSDLYVSSHRAQTDIAFYRLNSSGALREVGRANAQSDIYGVCMGQPAGTTETFVFATSDDGGVQQFRVTGTGDTIGAELVGTFDNGGITEACAVDDANNSAYFSEETGGLHKLNATTRAFISTVDSTGPGGRLVADVEGVEITSDGFIVVSSQGESLFNVYDRASPHVFRGKFDIAAGNGIDGTESTDGIDVSVAQDLFVAHDNDNGDTGSNFKFVRWSEIASAMGLSQSSPLEVTGTTEITRTSTTALLTRALFEGAVDRGPDHRQPRCRAARLLGPA